jgi:hypothetical protein
MKTNLVLILVAVLGLALLVHGCTQAAPKQLMTPTTRLIYHGGPAGVGVFTFCDRGNRVYMTEAAAFAVVPNGCPDGSP